MPALGTLALILPLLGNNVRADLGAGVDSTTRGGLIPQDAEGQADPGADSALTLLAGTRLMSERTTFRLIYSPRFFFQTPGTIELGRPLVLQQLGAYYQTALSRRTNFGAEIRGSAGEVSYSYFNLDLEPGTAPPSTNTLPLFLSNALLQLDHSTSPRNTVGATVEAGYQAQPELFFGATDDRPLPTTINSVLTLFDQYALTARDTLRTSLRGGHIDTETPSEEDVDTPGRFSTAGALLSWQRRVSAVAEFGFEGGGELAYTHDPETLSFIPTALFNHAVRWRGAGQDWQSSSSGGVRGFFDAASATYRAQGFASYSILGSFGPRWSSGFSAFGSTPLDPAPLEPMQLESLITLEQPTVYQVSRNTSLRFGVRASARAPHVFQQEDMPWQWEVTGFFGVRYTVGTSHEQGAWLR